MTYEEAIREIQEEGMTLKSMELAIEALNKQIPKAVRIEGIAKVKALDIEYNEIHTYKCIRCPSCEKWIVVNVSHKYCEYCGQKIDWSEIGDEERN